MIGDRNGKLLDLGCAEGTFASCLGDGYDYHGIEISPERALTAKRRGLNVTCHDLTDGIPFPDQYFDVVVAGEFIEHVPDVSNFLKELNRVLKDDGIFVGSTPNTTSISHYIVDEILGNERILIGRPKYLIHYHAFNRVRLTAIFKLNGFMITDFAGVTLLPVSKLTVRLNKWLGKKFSRFSTCLVFRAEKAGKSNNSS